MPFDRFLIGPINTGLQNDLKPWLTPDDSFEQLQNAYVFRGRVRKRFGSTYTGTNQFQSRLRINIGTTDGSGNISVTVPGSIFKIGQMFSVGTEIFTVVVLGTPGVMLDTGAATVHTFDTTTGAVVINGAAVLTAVYFYPAQPVMGFANYDQGPINDQPSYGFDPQFAYLFTPGVGWDRSGSGTSPIWHGGNLNFFWAANWQGMTVNVVAMFVTNFQVTNPNGAGVSTDDPIWVTEDGSTWIQFIPYFLPAGGAPMTGSFVVTALMIVPFKNRLLLINTIENTNVGGGGIGAGTNFAYPQRVRYSFNGSPFAVNAWYEPNQVDNAGNLAAGAGFIDAPTEEQIISSEFIKDRLILFFERSTWELVYTGNELQPFVFQKINTELGTESTFSTVPFDKAVLTVGNVGVHACNGSNVERIDSKIPDEIFQIKNAEQDTRRIYGIRDYYTELVYWTFPLDIGPADYPTQVLVFNYRNGSWAINDDSITVFGYLEQQIADTWQEVDTPWEDADYEWSSGALQTQFRQVMAGNQEGYTFLIIADEAENAGVLQITNIVNSGTNVVLTIIDVNQGNDFFFLIDNIVGPGSNLNGNIYQVFASTVNSITIGPVNITGTYAGGGTAARVSQINILTKQFNPYVDKSRDVFIHKIDFCVDSTSVTGEITVDYYPSATTLSMINEGEDNGSIMGTGVLETFAQPGTLEVYQQRLWHPVYFQSDGEFIQLRLYWTSDQMTNILISLEDFQLEGWVMYCAPTTSRLQ